MHAMGCLRKLLNSYCKIDAASMGPSLPGINALARLLVLAADSNEWLVKGDILHICQEAAADARM